MRHTKQISRRLPSFSRLYLESLEDRLLLSGLVSATTPILPEPGVATIAELVQADAHPRADQHPPANPAASMQRWESGASELLGDQYIAAGGRGDATAESSTSPDDTPPDDEDDYITRAGANDAQPDQYLKDVTGHEEPGERAVDYPSEMATKKTDAATE